MRAALLWMGRGLLAFFIAALVANGFTDSFFTVNARCEYAAGPLRQVAFALQVAFNAFSSWVTLLTLKIMLRKCGVTDVAMAKDGREALAVLREGPDFDWCSRTSGCPKWMAENCCAPSAPTQGFRACRSISSPPTSMGATRPNRTPRIFRTRH